jgi:hypothetical protein
VATATSGNLTINVAAACRSFDMTSYVGVLTHASGIVLSVGNATGGLFKLVAGMTYTKVAASAAVNFVSTASNGGVGWPITCGGHSFGTVTFNGIGGKWQFQDTFTCSPATNITWTRGDIDTNSQAMVIGNLLSSGTGARTISLGSTAITLAGSTFQLSGIGIVVSPNTAVLTVVGQASQVSIEGSSALDWNGFSVDITSHVNGSGGTLTGTNFKDIWLRGLNKSSSLLFGSNCVITGTLYAHGVNTINRVLVGASALGVARTITAAVVDFTYADFQDLVGAGAANWNLTGIAGGAGDCGNNSGITFTTSVNRYAVAAGNWSSTAMWSATSGGSGGASLPLPQDDVFLDANSAAGTYTADMVRLGHNIDFTGFTRTFSVTIGASLYGSLTFSSGMTISGTQALILAAAVGTHTFTTNGKLWSVRFEIRAGATAIYSQQDAISVTNTNCQVTSGTWLSNNHAITLAGSFQFGSGNLYRKCDWGTSTVTFTTTSGSLWQGFTVPGADYTGLSSVTFVVAVASASTRTWQGSTTAGTRVFGTLTYTVAASTGLLVIQGNNTFNTINVGSARTLQLTAGTTTTVGTWNVNGTSGNQTIINSSTVGSTTTILRSLTTQVSQYVSVQDIRADRAVFQATPGGVNNGNNVNWIFGPAVDLAVQTGGASGAEGELTVPSGANPVDIAGQTDGVSGASGSIKVLRPFSVQVDGVSGVAIAAKVLRSLVGITDGESGAEGDLSILVTKRLEGVTSGVSGANAGMKRLVRFGGSTGNTGKSALLVMMDD